jgi:hypothetical protein
VGCLDEKRGGRKGTKGSTQFIPPHDRHDDSLGDPAKYFAWK